MKVYENVLKHQRKTFSLFFWGSLRILPRYDLKALILLEKDCIKSKPARQCKCFARDAVLNGKTVLKLKAPIWQPYPRKHCAQCKQMMRAEKIFPCVRILTLITPYPSPHTSGYIGIRIPQSVKILLVHFGIRYTAQQIRNPTNN